MSLCVLCGEKQASAGEICPIGEAHVAFLEEHLVHAQGGGEAVAGLPLGGNLQVIPKELLVVGVGAVLDDGLGTLHGALAAQVGDALLGDDDVDGVLAVVEVRHHGDNGTDAAAFCRRGAREDRDVCAAGEVA